jgi:hypothetical protein
MTTSECRFLNQWYQVVLGVPFQNGVTLVCVNFATIFCWCTIIDMLTSCMAKTQATTTFSPSMSTPPSPIFLLCVYPFRWSQKEFKGMFHDVEAPCMKHFLASITSIASCNALVIHVPLGLITSTQFTFFILIQFQV